MHFFSVEDDFDISNYYNHVKDTMGLYSKFTEDFIPLEKLHIEVKIINSIAHVKQH